MIISISKLCQDLSNQKFYGQVYFALFMDPFSLVSIARIKYSLESTNNRHSLLFKEEKVPIRVEEKIPIPGVVI